MVTSIGMGRMVLIHKILKFVGQVISQMLCGFASVSSTMNHTMEIEIDAPIFIVFRMYMPRMNTPGERVSVRDPKILAGFSEAFQPWNQEINATTLMVTHQDELTSVCDRTICLSQGCVVSDTATSQTLVSVWAS